MAIIKSFASYQNLSNFGTFINDQVRTSEYFRITEFKDTFTGGKNGFLIEGSEHLKETTEIKIEILDVTGTPIYYEPGDGIPEYYEGVSKIVSVHVYEDTPIGLGKITILGELKTYIDENGVVRDIPNEWLGIYNIKWERTFNVNKNLANETIVRFYRRPRVTIDEITKPIFNITTPFITQTGSLEGIPQQPVYGTDIRNWTAGTLYKLKITDDSNWTSSVDENIIEIPSLGYSATVKEVLNNKEIFVDVPYLISSSVSNFPATAYTTSFEYIEGQTFETSALTGSFARIKLTDLKTFVGDVARVKVYRKSRNEVGDYQFIQDTKLESSEILKDITTTANTELSYGQFTDTNIKNYWISGSDTHPMTINVDKLNASVKVDYTGTNYDNKALLITSQSLSLTEGVEYTLSFKTLLSGSNDPTKTLKAYFSGSDYPQQTIVNVTNSAIYTTKQNVTQNVKATKTGDTKLVFEFAGDDWYLANVSLQNAQETSFSPDEFTLIQDVPRKLASETYDFKFEFYDINNNYIPVDVTTSKIFNGGNSFTTTSKLLTFESDRTAFRFSSGSFGNPAFQQIGFKVTKQNLTGSVTYASAAFDAGGDFIHPSYYSASDGTILQYPGALTNTGDGGATLTIASFSGSVSSSLIVGSITYTASCDDLNEFETIYRFEDGDNAPGVFVTANTNQFIYKATDLSLNPSGQTITIEAKRKNLASVSTPLTVNSGSGKPPLTFVSTNATNGVDTFTLSGTAYPFSSGETTYFISGSDQFGNQFSDAIKISPVKILDGFSVAVTNENTSFPATSTGTVVGNLTASSGSITVKVGNEVISYASPITNNKFSASISSTSGLTANTFDGTNYSISNLSQDSGSLTLLVKYQDGGGTIISASKDVTYSKVKKAAPVLEFVIGNNNQSTDAKSTGEQITAFANSSLSVKEQYNGGPSTLTLVDAPTINSSSAFTPITKTTTNLTYPNMVTGTDSVELSITGSVEDSEGTSRFVFGNVSLTKIKKAAPILNFIVGNNNQSVTAKSTGAQIDTFLTASFNVLEIYNGVVTSKPLTITKINTTNSYATGSTTSTTLALPNITDNNVNSVDISITGSVTDSELTPRTVFGNVSLTKIKKAAPVVVATLSKDGQSITKTNTGVYGTPATFTISVNEGGTDYTYSTDGAVNTYQISLTGGTGTTTITPTTPTTDVGTTTAITITYVNSEGTTGTLTKEHKVNVTISGTNGTNGTNGDPGANGQTGPGVVHTGVWTSGRTYQFSNGLTDGTGRRDTVLWSTDGNAPYNTYYATTRQHLSATGNVANGAPHQSSQTGWTSLGAQDFFVAAKIGIFEDSFVQKTLNIGTNSNGAMAAANITLAGGSAYPYISIGQSASAGSQGYDVNGIFMGVVNVSNSPVYRLSLKSASNSLLWNGTSLTINGGGTFSGALSAATGTFNGSIRIGSGESVFTADTSGIYLGNETFGSAEFSVTPAGVLKATSGTIGGWTLGATTLTGGAAILNSGGSISIGTGANIFKAETQGISLGNAAFGSAPFRVTAAGDLFASNAVISGSVNATSGKIGGWNVSTNAIVDSTTKLKLNASRPAIEIFDASGIVRVDISNNTSLSSTTAGSVNLTPSSVSGFNEQQQTDYNNINFTLNTDMSPTDVEFSGTSPSFTSGGSVSGVFNLNANLFGTLSYTSVDFEPGGGGSVSYLNYVLKEFKIGIRVYQAGTPILDISTTINDSEPLLQNSSYSNTTSIASGNSLGNLTTAITLLPNTLYRFVPFIADGRSSAYRSGGNVDTFGMVTNWYTPKISSITIQQEVGKVELNPTGFQVVATNQRYMIVERTDQNNFVQIGGGLTATGNITAFSSDRRLKNNIQLLSNPLEKLNKLTGFTYNWNETANKLVGYDTNERVVGMFAQDVQEVLPEAVKIAPFDSDGNGNSKSGENYLTIQYEKIVPLLVECIKELKKEINELKENK